jgi:NTE family protein
VETLLGRLTADALFAAGNDFDDLPIPFRCITTDLLRSDLQVHSRGSLSRAAKASGTLPFIFRPVELDGRYLVDGGFQQNLPVSVARDLGISRAVIVDVSNVFLPDKEMPQDIVELWTRVMELGQYYQNRIDVGEDDVLIRVPLQPFRSLSFWAAEAIMEAGYDQAMRQLTQLQALRQACGDACEGLAPEPQELGELSIRHLAVEGTRRMSGGGVRRRLGLDAGDRIELEEAWEKADRLAREGSFHNVWLEFEPVDEHTTDLVVHVIERTRPVLEMGAHVITDDGAAAFGRLRADNLFGLGGARALSLRHSRELTSLDGRAEQSVIGPGTVGVIARASWSRELPEVYDRGQVIDHHVFRRNEMGLDVVARIRSWGVTLLSGFDTGESTSHLQSRSSPGRGIRALRLLHVGFQTDVLERLVADQRSGGRFRYTRALSKLGGEEDFWRLQAGAILPGPRWERLRPVLAGGWVRSSSDIPAVYMARAGGPSGWAGLRREEILAPQILWGRTALEFAIHPELRLEIMGAVGWSGVESLDESKPVWGGGARVALDTPLGPLRLGHAAATGRRGYLFFQFGYDF